MAAWRAFRILTGRLPAIVASPPTAVGAVPAAGARQSGLAIGTIIGTVPLGPQPALQDLAGVEAQEPLYRTTMGAAAASGWTATAFPVPSRFGSVVGVPLPPQPALERPHVTIER